MTKDGKTPGGKHNSDASAGDPKTCHAPERTARSHCDYSGIHHGGTDGLIRVELSYPQRCCLNTPTMTPCFNVGNAARYGSTGSYPVSFDGACLQPDVALSGAISIIANLELHLPVGSSLLPLLGNVSRSYFFIHPQWVLCSACVLHLLQLLQYHWGSMGRKPNL